MDRNAAFENDLSFMGGYASLPLIVYSINISLRFRYIYFETPKAACSTIKRFLIRNESPDIWLGAAADVGYDEFAQFHDREFSPLLSPKQVFPFAEKMTSGKYFRFCFVRNPYARLLSAYLDQVTGQHRFAVEARRQLGLPMASEVTPSFTSFVEAVCVQPIETMDVHWKPQYHHTCQHAVEYDFIGRVENFEQDIATVAGRLGLDLSLLERYAPHATQSANKLSQFYTPHLRRKVYEKFEKDFVHFGYPE